MKQPSKERIMRIDFKKLKPQHKKWYVYWRWFYDLEFFSNYFFSHIKVDKKTKKTIKSSPVHAELINLFQILVDLLILFPRDHAKSTYTFFYIMWCICYKQETAILLVMSEWLWIATIGKIRDEFENNNKLKSIFGRLVPERTKEEQGKKWTASQLQFLNGVEIEAIKLRWSVRGRRPTLIVVDDPQENKDVENPQIAKKFEYWFRSSVYNTLDPTGRCIMIWTVVWELCLVNSLRNDNRWFKTIEYTAVDNPEYETINGKLHLVRWNPLWEWKRSITALNDRLQKVWRDVFQQEYMHIPANLLWEKIWKEDELNNLIVPPYKEDTKFEWLKIYRKPQVTAMYWVDTSGGKQSGDFASIVVRNIYGDLLASYYAKVWPEVLVQVIDYLVGLWYRWVISIECNNESGGTTITLAQSYRRKTLLYRRDDIDRITKKKQKKYGWNTNVWTRRTLLGEYDVAIRAWEIYEVSPETLNEMKTFYRNASNGKWEAMTNHHDDAIMSDWICRQMRKERQIVEIKG